MNKVNFTICFCWVYLIEKKTTGWQLRYDQQHRLNRDYFEMRDDWQSLKFDDPELPGKCPQV